MTHRLNRWLGACTLILCCVVKHAHSQPSAPEPYLFMQQTLPTSTLLGSGTLRFFGLNIYDVCLWVSPSFEPLNFDAHPFALDIRYHRGFSAASITQRSLSEISRQDELSPDEQARWEQALASIMPDVQSDDRLTGLYQPEQGMSLWLNEHPLGHLNDPELARRFFGIWLSETTSEPELRRALLTADTGHVRCH